MGPLNGAQIHVVMDPRDTESAKDMMKNSPPAYLELFNEPDYAFPVDGIPVTPITDAVTAATNLKPLIDMDHKNTQYISPALMNANDPNWLSAFFANCENCLDQINIFALHVYDPEVSGVMYQITQLHKKWPDKKIWITELSPASSGCALDADGIVKYINTLVPEILSTAPYVERIFWNSGESDSPALNGAPTACSPSLTNPDGSATKVLEALGAICQSGGDSTATA